MSVQREPAVVALEFYNQPDESYNTLKDGCSIAAVRGDDDNYRSILRNLLPLATFFRSITLESDLISLVKSSRIRELSFS